MITNCSSYSAMLKSVSAATTQLYNKIPYSISAAKFIFVSYLTLFHSVPSFTISINAVEASSFELDAEF
jgi:hypothetical protein